MNLIFQSNGNLFKGIHILTLEEFEKAFGYNDYRKKLIEGLKKGLKDLKDCGCTKIFIDGSFVTKKEFPGDFDACWDTSGVNFSLLISKYSILVDFKDERKNQKAHYYGEFFPAENIAQNNPMTLFLDFFQKDKDNNVKGIVQINLN